jgi:hypothetical protein
MTQNAYECTCNGGVIIRQVSDQEVRSRIDCSIGNRYPI